MNDNSNFSDEQLVYQIKEGNVAAEEVLFSRYARVVRAQSRRFVLTGSNYEDLCQEGFLGLLSAVRHYDTNRNVLFRTFAETCIHRKILSVIRASQAQKIIPEEKDFSYEDISEHKEDTRFIYSGNEVSRSPEEQVLAKELSSELSAAFTKTLSAKEYQILEYYLEGYPYHDISEFCHCSEKSVDNAVQRIRRKLARNPYFSDISKS